MDKKYDDMNEEERTAHDKAAREKELAEQAELESRFGKCHCQCRFAKGYQVKGLERRHGEEEAEGRLYGTGSGMKLMDRSK
jgi:hypothetical protein